MGVSPPHPYFLFPPSPLLEVRPNYWVWGSAVSSPRGVRGRAPAENKFGAAYSCQKATGGNYCEYSKVHVSQ